MRKEVFTVRVLDDADFDKLPYKGISDSLGFADPETGDAFIRRTGVKEMDMATIQHEIDHLISENKTHMDEYGIMHKKGKDFVRILAPIVGGVLGGPLLGGLASSVLGVGSTMGSAIGGALGSTVGSIGSQAGTGQQISPLKTVLSAGGGALTGAGMASGIADSAKAGGGFLGKTASGLQKMVTGTSGATKALEAATAPGTYGALANQGIVPKINPYDVTTKATLPSGQTISAASPINSIGSGLSSGLSNGLAFNMVNSLGSSNAVPKMVGSVGSSSSAPDTQNVVSQAVQKTGGDVAQKTVLQQAGDLVKQNALGLGLTAASAVPKTPQFQMPSGVEDIRSKLMQGGSLSDLGQQARNELSTILKSTPQEIYPTENDAYYQALTRRVTQNYADAQKQLDAAYNLSGTYGSGEHLAQKEKLSQQEAEAKNDIASLESQRRFELARTAKYQAIQDSLNVDKATMDDLIGLTGLDVQTAAMVYGANVEDVQAIREALGTAGSTMLLQNALKTQQAPSINVNLT